MKRKKAIYLKYFHVLVPPVISMLNPGRNITVRKGSTVKLVCNATGFPKPEIVWERQVSHTITFRNYEFYSQFSRHNL